MTGEEMYNLFYDDLRKEANLTEKDIDIGKFNISYLEGGTGETILFIHGFSANKEGWTSFAKYFTPNFHVVAIDLPGHGKTSKIKSECYSTENQAKWLDQFVSTLGIDKFHIAGNSMGGQISGKYAVTFPDKVLSLGLIDTGGVPSSKQSEVFDLIEKGEKALIVESIEDFDRVMGYNFDERLEIPEPLKGFMAKLSIENKDINEKIFQDIMEEYYSLEDDLSKINTKTFILWGDLDRVIDVSSVEILEKGLSDSEAVIMKNCGHAPMVERAEEAANHYLNFLNSK